MACRHGDLDAFERLLEHGADAPRPERTGGAASTLEETMVELALAAGADVDSSELAAALHGDERRREVMQALLERDDAGELGLSLPE